MTSRIPNAKTTLLNTYLRNAPRPIWNCITNQLLQSSAKLGPEAGKHVPVQVWGYGAARVHQLAPAGAVPEQLQSTLGVAVLADLR